ncbi:timeless-domain-containing protein [Apiospora marii]|uniref:Topoisomerase 1-associated factor 1 n=1 Tax=Apiospora marii TaxID=335849 RepID=A0ABR1R2K3_9PEZI
MEASEGSTDVVHPEVRAHINSLVSALGGFSADDDGRYVLGDSALEVLRDIKKWIRFYDEKTNRMDVARCLAEANLIDGDLLHILATWPENANDNKFKARVALACFEILVPLTWPLDRNKEEMTVNHHRHIPVLQLAQLAYKRSVINFDAAQILHTAVRVALPSLAIPRNDRSTRDEGIIKLVLLFLRNIAMISPPPGVVYDGDESQISRSALIDAFSYQDILITILTIASNMGEDFNQEGLVVMEIIFHLVKRVNINQLFMDDKQVGKAKSDELSTLMQKEAAMHRSHNRKVPTRHSRWGSMLWIKRDDGKVSTISGQDALKDAATREQKMDSSKVYRPPRRPRKEEMEPKDLGPRTSLNSRAREQLRSFVEEFLDSGFNPLFMHVRKKLDEQKDYVFEYHHRQFFYLTSWFLEAEKRTFNLVAGVLNQETFITLNRAMGDAMENKNWPELTAAMRCFTQILLTVQEMTETGNEEDEEIAENILGRIFYEVETHERIATIARNFKDQGFEFLDACTELTHTYLRVLEAYSKQNVDMQVRSRRRTRKKKKAAKAADENEENPVDEGDESENDQASAEKTSTERKFQFGTFTNKFTQQGVVDTFVQFTKFYHDLNDSQLKRAHRYFYRLAFKQNMSVMLFRVDIIHLFYNIIKGQEPLDKQGSAYKEWEELVKQILKKCIRKIEERPALLIEMLFSKINATAHYLEYGYEKQTISSSKPRAAAELEFRHIIDHDQQVAVAVGVLLDKELSHHIKWVKGQLAAAAIERRAWEAAEKAMPSIETNKDKETAESADRNEGDGPNENGPAKEPPSIFVRPDDDARRTAMFKNSHLRLLMKLVGFQRNETAVEETPKSDWIIPSSYTADQLQESIDLINKAEFDPPTFEDGALAENQLRRKTAPRKKAVFDDEDDNDVEEDENLFPAGGPTVRKVIDENGGKPRKIRKRRRRASNSEPLDDEEQEEKARKRRERELEKARRFKSDVYVHASDDDTDDERDREFFANEERLRQKQKALVISTIGKDPSSSPKATSVKRKAQVLLDDDSENDDLPMTQDSAANDDEDEDGASTSGTDDMPVSSGGGSPAPGGAKKRRRRMAKEPEPARPEPEGLAASLGLAVDTEMADADADKDDDEEEEDAVSKPAPRRRARGKAGFIIDSSDEE